MFQQTIKTINREHYSTEQLDIWSGQAGWINRLEQDVTFVATIQTYIVGFITIKDDGLIDLLKEPSIVRIDLSFCHCSYC
ncbi:hypothetical protein P4561_20265 [Priestia flexa]|uniref:hypothetical protein n=1 Tax=Priestia flexa TaxID=86664 RepID=UPI002E205030|nr:hypothetical protein [Priestia flexa]